MGLRGPGAKPISKIAGRGKKQSWERRGLSRAQRVIVFLETLPITSGSHSGRKFKLRDWQRKYIEDIYAETNGVRLIRTAVLSMGRKNGKTDLAARLALCHLSGPESEQRGETFAAANDRFQSGRLFSEMAAIIERVPFLNARISLKRHEKTMLDVENGSIFAALSADATTKMGLSPSFTVYDELGQAPKRDLFDALDTASGARSEPLMVVISTQAATDLAPMSELVDYGLKINSGEIVDSSFHLTLYAAPPELDPWLESTWKLANPALGDFRSLADVQRMALQAKRLPTKESAFRNLILNQRVSGDEILIPRSEWKACGDDVDRDKLKGRKCYGGLDLGGARDLTSLVLVFEDDEKTFDVWPFFFVPEIGLADREAQERVPYGVWHDQGLIETMPGRTMDPGFVAKRIAQLHGEFNILKLAFDRWRIHDLQRELDALGCEIELVPHGQGFKDFGPAVDNLLRLVTEKMIRHGNNAALTNCVANAKPIADPAGNLKLDKSKSTGRIDGAVALAMALNVARISAGEIEWEPFCEAV
jgi:phage terminase large subunit-like protein